MDNELADICIAMAKDIHESITGKRPTEAETAKTAQYLYNVCTKGALAFYLPRVKKP